MWASIIIGSYYGFRAIKSMPSSAFRGLRRFPEPMPASAQVKMRIAGTGLILHLKSEDGHVNVTNESHLLTDGCIAR
jgi:hypothetical protein